jgi:tetratricopeptide (TPR) repeat protein
MQLALGVAHAAAGDLDVARTYLGLAVEGVKAKFGPDHLAVGDRINDLATVEMSAVKPLEAVRLLDEALAIYARNHALNHLSVGYILVNRSYSRLLAGDCAGAVADATASEDILLARLGDESSDLITLDSVRGECLRRERKFEEARAVLARAERIATTREVASRVVDEMRFTTGQAIWEGSVAERAAAKALVVRARDDLTRRARAPLEKSSLADMNAWLKARGEP